MVPAGGIRAPPGTCSSSLFINESKTLVNKELNELMLNPHY